MKILTFSIMLLSILCFMACNPGLTSFYASKDTINIGPESPHPGTCQKSINYAADLVHPEHSPLRTVRLNFHFMRPGNGEGNFPENEVEGYIVKLLAIANNQYLANNKPMNLPPGNTTPVHKTNYRYVLNGRPDDPHDNGIYFHDDDELAYFNKSGNPHNKFRKTEYQRYGIQKDTVINVFMQEHIPDSIASPTYYASATGVGFGKFAKLAGAFQHSRDTVFKSDGSWFTKGPNWYAPLLNHEIGHCLGLSHTWSGNDGCTDTPNNPNCYNKASQPPCDEYNSNNMMDYNACQCSLTPCQLGKIHYNFFRENSSKRKFLVEAWCTGKNSEKITIGNGQDIKWYSGKDLEGDLIIKKGGKLTVYCELGLPAGAKIEVKTGGTLVLDGCVVTNRCDDQWEGIQIWKKDKESGMVEFRNNARLDNCNHPIILNAPDK